VAGGAFFSLGVADAKALIEKMVSNQGWKDERLQPHKRRMHSLNEADMIVAKMNVLAKKLEQYEKMSTQDIVQSLDSHMICEVCGESGHSGNHFPRLMKISTSSTMIMVFANQINDRISAPILKVTF